jgi:hypothetical protein
MFCSTGHLPMSCGIRSAYLGALIAQFLRRRNDADLHTAGDSRLRTADVR